ncbi:MAG TPA: ATP--guanido phosphotransferase [Planctomycetes bacterium]|nr:ATP--guanido phosphotransferase [Planctomycetota bacterium]
MEAWEAQNAWLGAEGEDSDVVISTRVRLARNIEGFSFSPKLEPKEAQGLVELCQNRLAPLAKEEGWEWVDLQTLSPIARQVLVERRLISRELKGKNLPSAVLHDPIATVSLMIGEEDHLRLQVFRSGLALGQAFDTANQIDDRIADCLPLSFSHKFGFLTTCPTNTGTGMRVSVMLHLPALALTQKEIQKATNSMQEMGMTVRGPYGEGSQASGDLFQISNQRTLGASEGELIQSLENAVHTMIRWERKLRADLGENANFLKDRVYRALGVLSSAHILSSSEALDLLSMLRLGRFYDLPGLPSRATWNRLFLLTQPGHLMENAGQELDPGERDFARAALVREILAKG